MEFDAFDSLLTNFSIGSNTRHLAGAREYDATYDFGNHAAGEFDIAVTVPVDVEVELDAARVSLSGENVGQPHWNWAQIDFGEVQ